MTNELNTPWSLHFDRDGTEDFGIICDAEMNDLVASHLPSTKLARLANRPFGTGCFWLPEEEGEEMPMLVRQMQVMTAAPKLLAALLAASDWIDTQAGEPRTEIQATVQQAIADATGRPFGHCVPQTDGRAP